MADATTIAASAVAPIAAGLALQMPGDGVILCSVIGAASAALLDQPPDSITLRWVRVAVARAVGFVSIGIIAPYVLPALLHLDSIGHAPGWSVSLLASWLAPYILQILRAKGSQ